MRLIAKSVWGCVFGTLLCGALWTGSCNAQDAKEKVLFSDDPSVSVARSKPTAAELRQAIAMEKRRQSIARMEANAWAGYSTLRPAVPANPYGMNPFPYYTPVRIWTIQDVLLLPR
jgi:hypothetical protein